MVGKKIGKDNIYVHSSGMKYLPPHLIERVKKAIFRNSMAIDSGKGKHFKWNFVITHPDHIELVEAEDFDNTYEPILGQRNRITDDGEVTHIPRPAKPRVLHQRYKTVKPDYDGFDIEDDKKREEWYRSHFDARRMSGAGFHHKWMEMLAEIEEQEKVT